MHRAQITDERFGLDEKEYFYWTTIANMWKLILDRSQTEKMIHYPKHAISISPFSSTTTLSDPSTNQAISKTESTKQKSSQCSDARR